MNNKVIILHNKISACPTPDELDVLDQVNVVHEALIKLGYLPEIVPFSFQVTDIIHIIKNKGPSFIFNLVEGMDNDGQLIFIAPSILDYLRIPYTGCSKESIFLTSNKVIAKKFMTAFGIPTLEWVTMEDEKDNTFIEGERYILKPVWEDGSLHL
jgi:D-alanine-D-alanine ligase